MSLIWWAVVSAVIAMIAGGLGFSNVAAGAAKVSRILFGIFLVLALIFLAIGLLVGAGIDAAS